VARPIEHGHRRRNATTPEYTSWVSMRRRCLQPTDHNYHRYGSRGIRICERWGKYENFISDMGRKPSSEYSLDRIDNDGNYEPGNCRWATPEQQANNTKATYRISIDGTSLSIAQWARKRDISDNVIRARIRLGWSDTDAVLTSVRPKVRGSLTGQIFGSWTVLSELPYHGGKRYYTCRCSCGTLQDVQGYRLRKEKTVCCTKCLLACKRKESVNEIEPGRHFGKWVVVQEVTLRASRSYLCRCDCGNEKVIRATALRSGRSTQCASCAHKESWHEGRYANRGKA
jgi:hypothetical protein